MAAAITKTLGLWLLGVHGAAISTLNFPFPSFAPSNIDFPALLHDKEAALNEANSSGIAHASLPQLLRQEKDAIKMAAHAFDQYNNASVETQALLKEEGKAVYNQRLAKQHADAAQAKLKTSKEARVQAAKNDVGSVPVSSGDVPSKSRLASAQATVDEAELDYLKASEEKTSVDAASQKNRDQGGNCGEDTRPSRKTVDRYATQSREPCKCNQSGAGQTEA